MFAEIIDFWKSNNKLWLPITEKDKIVADQIIYDRYYWTVVNPEEYLLNTNIFSKIVYYDQFYRHFDRHSARIGMPKIIQNEHEYFQLRSSLASIVRANIDQIVMEADEIDILFTMMLFKHIGEYDFIFDTIHNKWLGDKSICGYTYLSRFYQDTYRKAYSEQKIYSDIQSEHSNFTYRPDVICEYYPENYICADWPINVFGKDTSDNFVLPKFMSQLAHLTTQKNIIVSLSGGVDSMVLLAILKYMGLSPLAVHIIYGNRVGSEEEYHFIGQYCKKLAVPLYTYRIQWLRRSYVDREFYETMTRQIRFMVYKAVGGENPKVIMGHIKEDIVENIWTNLAKCQHLDNLKKMSRVDTQLGVQIIRPFLEVEKKTIYAMSVYWAIPFLNNTTPSWSNRGKFREHFYEATHKQFGEGVDDKLIHLAEMITRQYETIERLVYKPIFDSWDPVKKTINITNILSNDIQVDIDGWRRIFEHVCHQYLGIGKPSIHSIHEFMNRLNIAHKKGIHRWQMPIKKGIAIEISMSGLLRFNCPNPQN